MCLLICFVLFFTQSICCLYDLLIVNNMYLNKMLHEVFNSSQKKPKSNKQLPHKILNQIHQNGLNGHSNGHGAGAVSMQNGNRSNGLSDEKLKDNRHFFLLLLRQSILCFGCVALLYLRWIVMGSAPPVFQKVDNPASFLNNTLEKVSLHSSKHLKTLKRVCVWVSTVLRVVTVREIREMSRYFK